MVKRVLDTELSGGGLITTGQDGISIMMEEGYEQCWSVDCHSIMMQEG